jgi:hypothetical protein
LSGDVVALQQVIPSLLSHDAVSGIKHASLITKYSLMCTRTELTIDNELRGGRD